MGCGSFDPSTPLSFKALIQGHLMGCSKKQRLWLSGTGMQVCQGAAQSPLLSSSAVLIGILAIRSLVEMQYHRITILRQNWSAALYYSILVILAPSIAQCHPIQKSRTQVFDGCNLGYKYITLRQNWSKPLFIINNHNHNNHKFIIIIIIIIIIHEERRLVSCHTCRAYLRPWQTNKLSHKGVRLEKRAERADRVATLGFRVN